MALSISSKKTPQKPKAKPVVSAETVQVAAGVTITKAALENLVASTDAYEKVADKLAPLEIALKAAKDVITKEVDESPLKPEDGFDVVFGKREVKVGKKAQVTNINVEPEALHQMLDAVKPGLFYELATVNLGDLKKYLTPDQLEPMLSVANSGKRVIKVI